MTVRPKKLILVSAEYHPLHKMLYRLCEEAAKEAGVEFEYRKEDYVFLSEHGKKDEFGFAGIPQVFVEMSDGGVKLVLWEVPLDERLKPDKEKVKKILLEALKA